MIVTHKKCVIQSLNGIETKKTSYFPLLWKWVSSWPKKPSASVQCADALSRIMIS